MKPDLKKLMEQAQLMQKNMQNAQQELMNMTVTGEAGGGLVKVTMNGRHEAKNVFVDVTMMNEEKAVLEDLIAAAINDAVHRIDKESQRKIAGLTAGLKLPPEFQMPDDQEK